MPRRLEHEFDQARVARAKRWLAKGIYDDPGFLDLALDVVEGDKGPGNIADQIRTCPIGDGNQYRDLIASSICKSLECHIDKSLIRKERPVAKGRFDIELPIQYRALEDEPIFRRWHNHYGVLSLIIESKNEKKRGSVDDFRQIKDYLENAGLGRVGFLVCRSGFSRDVLKRLSAEARKDEYLILPFDGMEVEQLAEMYPLQVPEWLHQKEIRLRQAS